MEIRNIAVRSPNWIGDFVMSVPAVTGIRKRFLDANLTIVAHKRVSELSTMLPGVDNVVEFDEETVGRSIRNLLAFSRGISGEPIDLFLVFPLSFSSALMSFLSRARMRVGYASEMRGFLLTESVELPRDYRSRHLLKSYARLVEVLGVDADGDEPRLDLPSDCESALRVLRESGVDPDERPVGLAPFASYGPAKRWPVERYAELSAEIVRRHGCKIVVFGAGEDAGKMPSGCGLVDMCGRLSLREAAWALARCRCLVSNDTGMGHLAAAAGAPVVSIFGSTSPAWTAPVGSRNRVVCGIVECNPCFERVCRFGHYKCLLDIDTRKVLDRVEEVLGEQGSVS